MNAGTLAALAVKHFEGAIAEEIYLKTGYDMTKPTIFYGEINERCNIKCRYCAYWRLPKYVTEMTIEEWKRGLVSIKDFVGKFSINFSGGEGFLKPGFLDLIAWCTEKGIPAGLTTNGTALTQKNAEKLVAARPMNLNISIDSAKAEVNDYQRGYKGLLEKVTKGIKYVVAERERQGASFPIIIKPAVTSLNFRDLPELLEWTKAIGATCLYPQPLSKWTPETYDELWIKEKDLPELDAMVQRLIDLKRAGEPIMTPEPVLRLMSDHFRDKKAPPDSMPCRVGLRNCFILANGDVYMCQRGFPSVGNLKTQTLREIWYSDKAKEVRKHTTECERLCLGTCLSPKSLTDKVKMGLVMLRGSRSPKKVTDPPKSMADPARSVTDLPKSVTDEIEMGLVMSKGSR